MRHATRARLNQWRLLALYAKVPLLRGYGRSAGGVKTGPAVATPPELCSCGAPLADAGAIGTYCTAGLKCSVHKAIMLSLGRSLNDVRSYHNDTIVCARPI